MDAYSLELIINAREMAAKAFIALKRFDSNIVMGTALLKMRERKPFEVALDRPDRATVLVHFIELLEELERWQISYEVSANNVPRSSEFWEPKICTRGDLVAGVEALRQQALEAERDQQKAREWAKSPEGLSHAAWSARLESLRKSVHARWNDVGFENLRPSEKNCLYVWWLAVEVEAGTFEQYFFNSAGDTALLALSALELLGLPEAHAVLSDALSVFNSVGGYQPDRTERWKCMDKLPEGAFQAATVKFYGLEDIRALALLAVEHEYEHQTDSGTTPVRSV